MTDVISSVEWGPGNRVEATAPRPGAGLDVTVAVLASLAWALLVAGEVGGISLLDHDAVFAGDRIRWPAVGMFLLGWQVMVAAMMLPASFPVLRAFVMHGGRAPGFLFGFAGVWTAFGIGVLSLDAVVHRIVEGLPWLSSRRYLVAAGLLLVVGAAQLTRSTAGCLEACRALTHHSGAPPGRLRPLLAGARYGQLCVRCDGGLMLLAMLAPGDAGTLWMAIVALAMFVERSARAVPLHRWATAVVLGSAAATMVVGLS